jgi:DNA-binding CsgD family transcriptional regulator
MVSGVQSRMSSSTLVPFGLRVARTNIGGEEVAVFSFPLTPFGMPQSLSAAERAVTLAMLDGRSNAQIAAARRSSVRTVANQVASVFRKLGVRSRSEAMAALARIQRC